MRSGAAEAAMEQSVHRQTHWLVEMSAAQARLVSISVGNQQNTDWQWANQTKLNQKPKWNEIKLSQIELQLKLKCKR